MAQARDSRGRYVGPGGPRAGVTPGQFAAGFPGWVRQIVEELAIGLHRETHRRLFLALTSPPHLPLATGRFRGSFKGSKGSPEFAGLGAGAFFPIPGEPEATRPIEGLQLGETSYITNDASSDAGRSSYATILEGGRSRMAPRGVFGPTIQDLAAQGEQIAREVADEVAGRWR